MIIMKLNIVLLICGSIAYLVLLSKCITKLTLTKPNHNSQPNHSNERKLQSSSFADTFPERQRVLEMSQLSHAIYKVDDDGLTPQSAVDTFNNNYNVKLWIDSQQSSTNAMVVQSKVDSSVVVVFRGSEDFDDWLTNINLFREDSKFDHAPNNVKLHRGFQNAVFTEDVLPMIETKVLDLVGANSNGKLFITGHSLGGALAHITAAYMADRYQNLQVQMINFGAPRFGNKAFKEWTENNLKNLSAWRFVNRNDIVPRIVPRKKLGYIHAGHLFQIYRFRSKSYYRQTGQGSYDGAPSSWYYGTSINHHKMSVIRKQFQNRLNKAKFWPANFEMTVEKPQCPWWNPSCWF